MSDDGRMVREFDGLKRGPFDLLVVGGGIYGAWTAYDAALRGLSVALVESRDWSSGTSSASSKLIHGGLRYLEYGRLGLVRKSLAERRRLARVAPHQIRPLRFVIPVYSGARTGMRRLRLGLWLYDLLAGQDQPVEGRRAWSRRELTREFPFLEPELQRGGMSYGDCGNDDARLTLEVVAGALAAGAVAVNRARASELLVEEGRVAGARVVDDLSGSELDVRARMTAICAGPWTGDLIDKLPAPKRPRLLLSKGVHLVLPGLGTDDAFLLIGTERGRVVFLIPWYGRTLLGTTDDAFTGDPSQVRVTPQEERELLDQANRFVTRPRWSSADVIARFAGVRTLAAGNRGPTSSVSREFSIIEPIPGAILPLGGKYTSAREDASQLVDRIRRRLGGTYRSSKTGVTPLPWTPPDRFSRWRRETVTRGLELGLDEVVAGSLTHRYGARAQQLHELLTEDPRLAHRLDPETPFCLAEVVFSARNEMVNDLEDLLRRRLPWSLVARSERPAVERLAHWAAGTLGWSDERTKQEVDAFLEGRT